MSGTRNFIESLAALIAKHPRGGQLGSFEYGVLNSAALIAAILGALLPLLTHRAVDT